MEKNEREKQTERSKSTELYWNSRNKKISRRISHDYHPQVIYTQKSEIHQNIRRINTRDIRCINISPWKPIQPQEFSFISMAMQWQRQGSWNIYITFSAYLELFCGRTIPGPIRIEDRFRHLREINWIYHKSSLNFDFSPFLSIYD